jgi:D-alanyl-D-alanine carboxypeptidase
MTLPPFLTLGPVRRQLAARAGAAGLIVATLALGCTNDGESGPDASSSSTAPRSSSGAEGDDEWQQLVDQLAADSPGVPGIALAVLAPGTGVDVAVAAGDAGGGSALTPDRPFRIASNTKTYTAAATLRLVETGMIGLDDPIVDRIDPVLVDLLAGDGYVTDAITVRHLLQHTSGIYDYASDVDYQTVVLGGHGEQHWERVDQVRFAVERGDPIGPPGEQYAYSDTGYILLGDLLERATERPLAGAYRQLLEFDRLGLEETWLETVEPPPPGTADRAHQYYEDLDTYDADPSFDLYGGGGLVSTVGDLAAFYRALFAGDVFADPETLAVMTTVPPVSEDAGAAMGLFRFEESDLGECWTHSGFWGTVVISCADRDIAIALSVFQASPDPPFDGDELIRRVADMLSDGGG